MTSIKTTGSNVVYGHFNNVELLVSGLLVVVAIVIWACLCSAGTCQVHNTGAPKITAMTLCLRFCLWTTAALFVLLFVAQVPWKGQRPRENWHFVTDPWSKRRAHCVDMHASPPQQENGARGSIYTILCWNPVNPAGTSKDDEEQAKSTICASRRLRSRLEARTCGMRHARIPRSVRSSVWNNEQQ